MYLYQVFQSSSGRCYWYDTTTNHIFRIPAVLHRNHAAAVDDTAEGGDAEEVQKARKFFRDVLLKKGYVRPYQAEETVYQIGEDIYIQLLERNLVHIILEVTRQCNLRCGYCVYSGSYSGQRRHQDNTMSLETAKKAIDFYAEHSENCLSATIGFYGGEPLLEFARIRDIVAYARRRFAEKQQRYLIATNGTLVNREVARWLSAHPDVQLNITLNGENHDRYRTYADGAGSYGVILSNMRMLAEDFPETYQNQVGFLCNYTTNRDLEEMVDFYDRQLQKIPVSITRVMQLHGNDRIHDITAEDPKQRSEIYSRLRERYLSSGTGPKGFLNQLFDSSVIAIHRREDRALNDVCEITGGCLPFVLRMFVNCDGTLNLCERMPAMKNLGNVLDGFHIPALLSLMKSYREQVGKDCLHCWAQRFCHICLRNCLNEGVPDERQRKEECARARRQVLSELSLYCDVWERAPHKLEEFARLPRTRIFRKMPQSGRTEL